MNLIQTDKKRVVVGLGVTGLSTMRFLKFKGFSFSAVDTRDTVDNIEAIKKEFFDVKFVFGSEARNFIDEASDIYLSPGISIEDPVLIQAKQNGAVISGDVDLFFNEVKAPVIAITGSNAKSTVTTLLGNMAATNDIDAGVGGNLGIPMLDLLMEEKELYVLELSSFQLERASDFNLLAGCILNLSEDHIDRHGSMVVYHQVKQKIYRGAEYAIYNRDDLLTAPLSRVGLKQIGFGLNNQGNDEWGLIKENDKEYIAKGEDKILDTSEIKVFGKHNAINIMAALALAEVAGFNRAKSIDAVRKFEGLSHRCQFVKELQGVQFFNDSKATNVGATVAAVKGYCDEFGGTLFLILGGVSKGANFKPLAEELKGKKVKCFVYGQDATQITNALSEHSVDFEWVDDLSLAIHMAYINAFKGDIVLLSPACSSLDMFANYEKRGDFFSQTVNNLPEKDCG